MNNSNNNNGMRRIRGGGRGRGRGGCNNGTNRLRPPTFLGGGIGIRLS